MFSLFKNLFKKDKPGKVNISYNSRADGYGAGESESRISDRPQKQESTKLNDDGTTQQKGEMDQYTFRDH